MKITGNEPANPIIYRINENVHTGLTIRQQFAMAAMQGILSTPQGLDSELDVARKSVRYADALINELNKSEQ